MELNIKGPYEIKLDPNDKEPYLRKKKEGYNYETVKPIFFIAEDRDNDIAILVNEKATLETVIELLAYQVDYNQRPRDDY